MATPSEREVPVLNVPEYIKPSQNTSQLPQHDSYFTMGLYNSGLTPAEILMDHTINEALSCKTLSTDAYLHVVSICT